MKALPIVILFLFSCTLGIGQTLNGNIQNQLGDPIEDAQIFSLRTGEHAHSNHVGKFSLDQVREQDTLRISHLNYQFVDVVVKDLEKPLRITLQEKIISIEAVNITSRLDAINAITDIDLRTDPVTNSQEILRKVPGLFIGQHAGGGKAEQIFLRGFDIDHGTDINITVDGMPVNMVSHAHGQGYADLHFLIPETVDNINFGKGPYYADQGNFTTAGHVDFRTVERPENSLVKLEVGQFNTQRLMGLFNLLNNNENHAVWVASEYLLSDGPFESPQNMNRLNLMGKYTGYLDNLDRISVSASYFSSSWDASGQVPQRSIDDGSITRFGAIDPTEGGNTKRANVLLDYTHNLNDRTFIKNSVYYSRYEFELFSNFTFFLEDSINGDQIRQREVRNLSGVKSEVNHTFSLGKVKGTFKGGAGFRSDQSYENELSHTRNRTEVLELYQYGDIHETNFFSYVNGVFELGKFALNPSVRVDHFKFNYYDRLAPTYETQTQSRAIVSPKVNLMYNPSSRLQLYLKTGRGFHSNDTRVVLEQRSPQVLPAAYGADLGFLWKPVPNMLINVAGWYLHLDQEFVYVGDAGIVEPSGQTRRTGVDLSFRYQPLSWLFLDADANYTFARSIDEPENENFIPLAPDLTAVGGFRILHPSVAFYGGSRRALPRRSASK